MTNDRMLPDPSDYSDGTEPLDDEMVVREWESNLLPQDAVQALDEMVRDADYEVIHGGHATKEEIVECVGIRGTVLDLIIELEGYWGKMKPQETKINYTLEQIQDLYVEPVRKELQGALDIAAKCNAKLEAEVKESDSIIFEIDNSLLSAKKCSEKAEKRIAELETEGNNLREHAKRTETEIAHIYTPKAYNMRERAEKAEAHCQKLDGERLRQQHRACDAENRAEKAEGELDIAVREIEVLKARMITMRREWKGLETHRGTR